MAKWEIIEDNKFKKQTGGKAAATRAIAPKKTLAKAATNAAYATILNAADDKKDLIINSLQNVASDAYYSFWNKYNKSNETNVYANDTNKIKLNTGRFTGANVPSTLIDDLASAANRNNIPVGQMLALAGRESTFGQDKRKKGYAHSDKAEYVSGWNVANQYEPYSLYRFLADKKVPGISTFKNTHGWSFLPKDEEKIITYTKAHPELIDEYKSKIAKTLDVGDKNAYDLAAIQLKNKGVQSYNPNDPNYVKMFQKDYDSLKQDKNLMNYLQKKGYDYENVKPQESSQPVVLSPQKPGQSVALPLQFKIGGKVSGWEIIDDVPKFKKGGKTNLNSTVEEEPKNTVKVNQNGQIIEYDPSSPEYKKLYESGTLTSYDPETDAYITPTLKEFTVVGEKPKWAKEKENNQSKYSKDWYIDNYLPKFSRNMGISADNMNPNDVERYNSFINDKTAEDIFKRYPTFDSDYANDRLGTLKQFSPKEVELIKNSSYASALEPNVWDEFKQAASSAAVKLLTSQVPGPSFPNPYINKNLTYEEAQEASSPLNLLAPLSIPYNMTTGNAYTQQQGEKNYSWEKALKGQKPIHTSIAASIAGDPLNLLGLGLFKGLVSAGKIAKLEDAYQLVKGLGKEEALSKLKSLTSLDNYGREAFTPMLDNIGVEAFGAVNPSTLKTNPFINTVEPQTSFFSRNPSVFTNRTIPQETIDLSRREVFRRIGEQQPTTRRVYTLGNEEDLARFNVDNNFIPPPPSEYQSAMNLVGVNFSEAELNAMNVRDIARGLQDNINTSSNLSRIDLDALIPYKNLTYNQLVIKNPSLAEKLKNAFKGIKLNIKNVADKAAEKLTVANQKLGEIIEPTPIIDKNKFELDLQENLNKGVGIKKGDTQIQLKEKYPYSYQVHIKTPGETNFMHSGNLQFNPVQKQRSFTDILLNKNKYQGLKKPWDFPLEELKEKPNFNLDLPEYKGISAEIGEATKQALKNQNKKFDLLSSKSHTDEGGIRYLTEFLNGRKPAIDVSGNKEWLEIATELKNSLKGKPIRKEEVKKILAGDKYGANPNQEYNAIVRNPLFPNKVQFKYKEGGIIEDPMGQWAHPGSVTRIPSNQITMQGVNGPLYLQPNKGKGRLAYPNEEHYFPKASFVVEHPIKWQITED